MKLAAITYKLKGHCHATDGMDGNELNFEKIGQFFQVLMLSVPKFLKTFIMVSAL